jgi:hypothetical protein
MYVVLITKDSSLQETHLPCLCYDRSGRHPFFTSDVTAARMHRDLLTKSNDGCEYKLGKVEFVE